MATLTDITVGASTAPNEWDSPEVGTPPVMELVASANDSDYGRDENNATGTTTQGYLLDSVDSDFASMDTVFVQLRYKVDGTDPDLTIDSLEARIVRNTDGLVMAADGLGNFITIASSITNTSFQNSSIVELTNINGLANTKADWEDARVELRWSRTRSMGGGTIQCDVSALTVSGTYTTAAAATDYIAAIAHQLPQPQHPTAEVVDY
jgi:hypothetical protein